MSFATSILVFDSPSPFGDSYGQVRSYLFRYTYTIDVLVIRGGVLGFAL